MAATSSWPTPPGKPAALVMSLQRYEQLLDELNTLRRRNSDHA
ncbi:hypothetical protein QWI29_26685 [Mycolicibacterium neoaurum]|nr:hypothetical protein [Mycolicibacterium neoaurum]MDO3403646.1 hypothetical protein [Mycolicibacterium neoaurum]